MVFVPYRKVPPVLYLYVRIALTLDHINCWHWSTLYAHLLRESYPTNTRRLTHLCPASCPSVMYSFVKSVSEPPFY